MFVYKDYNSAYIETEGGTVVMQRCVGDRRQRKARIDGDGGLQFRGCELVLLNCWD